MENTNSDYNILPYKLHYFPPDEYIAYKLAERKDNFPLIVFLHGLLSDMNGSKAEYLSLFAEKNNYNFLRFDNQGRGNSSGIFTDHSLDSWLNGSLIMLDHFAKSGAIIVGSSLGGWLALLLAKYRPNLVKSLLLIAPAPDFTEDIWQKLDISEREKIARGEVGEYSPLEGYSYPVSKQLIEDSRKHLMFKGGEKITCPVSIIQGMRDESVPYNTAMRVMEELCGDNCQLTLVKDGAHNLSRDEDLKLIAKELERLVGQ